MWKKPRANLPLLDTSLSFPKSTCPGEGERHSERVGGASIAKKLGWMQSVG